MLRAGTPSTERRLLLELLANPQSSDDEIGRALALDRAQLSRALTRLIASGLVAFVQSSQHRSQRLLSLTFEGEQVARELDHYLSQAIRTVFAQLPSEGEDLLLRAAGASSRDALREDREKRRRVVIRPVGLADYSRIIGMLTHDGLTQYDWAEPYMAAVCSMVHDFIHRRPSDVKLGFVAYRDRKLVGVCLLIGTEDLYEAEVGALYVASELRKDR